ncbi:putative protein kinase [Zea mays]|uniref:Uncharacterized protein n=1 Tax=Zea mays TaxID=4577 RepID=A0A1D6E7L8_MAIZE|nr:putative protein kinase [Zea mays]
MGWWENAKSVFGDAGNVGCFPRIGRKQSKNSYAFPADPGSEKRRGSGGPAPAPEEVITVEVPEVPLRELNGITASFSGEKLIGQGSYAKVYQGQDRRLQHVQPGRGHGQAQPLHAHARFLRLPGARVRHDGPDDGQERRVQLRHRSPGAPDG